MAQSSNLLRARQYKRLEIPARFSPSDQILHCDFANKKVRVGAKMTMEKLVDALLPQGWIPCVVPEFKGITVGGAISGAAIESTSGLYGQFNDCCLSYEIWNGKEKLHASPEENRELFYGVSGSYGSLGVILEAEISVIPTTGFLGLHYESFSNLDCALDAMASSKDAVEALVFSEERIVLVFAKEIDRKQADQCLRLNLSSTASEWFYSHVNRVVKDKKEAFESISVRDYLFRHDRGAFWMAGYGLSLPVLASYLMHKWGFQNRSLLPHVKPKNPGYLYRALFGWFLDSQTLYKSLHTGGEDFFERKVVVQDFYLPKAPSLKFIKHVLKKYQITPLWICPVLSTEKPQIFSPHRTKAQELLFDIGVYGIPFGCSASEAVKEMEERVFEWGGKKMLYSQNYYPKEKFWEIYSKKEYEILRKKYTENSPILDIEEKVLLNDLR